MDSVKLRGKPANGVSEADLISLAIIHSPRQTSTSTVSLERLNIFQHALLLSDEARTVTYHQ